MLFLGRKKKTQKKHSVEAKPVAVSVQDQGTEKQENSQEPSTTDRQKPAKPSKSPENQVQAEAKEENLVSAKEKTHIDDFPIFNEMLDKAIIAQKRDAMDSLETGEKEDPKSTVARVVSAIDAEIDAVCHISF